MEKHKAVVVGGSNGIGLAITRYLLSLGYHVKILDVREPDQTLLVDDGSYDYQHCDLQYFNEELFQEACEDETINLLMITAGVGRVAYFEDLHIAEIDKLMTINAVSIFKIIKVFYNRIKCTKPFYCGVMGSITGFINSPLFSIYSASKAAIMRFIESVNVELDYLGSTNRILNVSPGSIKGTRFSGGDNDLSQTMQLAKNIVSKVFDRQEVYIPDYEETYRNVLERYHKNSHEFGLSSLEYKIAQNRVSSGKSTAIGYLSGTFDLFHIGHLNLLRRAKEKCDYLIVGVHLDASHKGKETFIPYEERYEIVKACRYVDKVVKSCPEDHDAWNLWHYDYLFVGSDYKGTERFKRYEEYFADKNVRIIYLPYTKQTSSTQIRVAVNHKINGGNAG